MDTDYALHENSASGRRTELRARLDTLIVTAGADLKVLCEAAPDIARSIRSNLRASVAGEPTDSVAAILAARHLSNPCR